MRNFVFYNYAYFTKSKHNNIHGTSDIITPKSHDFAKIL